MTERKRSKEDLQVEAALRFVRDFESSGLEFMSDSYFVEYRKRPSWERAFSLHVVCNALGYNPFINPRSEPLPEKLTGFFSPEEIAADLQSHSVESLRYGRRESERLSKIIPFGMDREEIALEAKQARAALSWGPWPMLVPAKGCSEVYNR